MRYNALGCSGLERYSLIPAFLAAAISSGSVLVLTAIMGIPGPSVWVEARISSCCLQTIHDRHLDICQKQTVITGTMLFKGMQRLASVGKGLHYRSGGMEKFYCQFTVQFINSKRYQKKSLIPLLFNFIIS